jgi:hypothetical protein
MDEVRVHKWTKFAEWNVVCQSRCRLGHFSEPRLSSLLNSRFIEVNYAAVLLVSPPMVINADPLALKQTVLTVSDSAVPHFDGQALKINSECSISSFVTEH